MKHYVIALRATVMGLTSYTSDSYISTHEDTNKVPELSLEYSRLRLQWDTFDEAMAKDNFQRLTMGLKTNDKQIEWPYTVYEFVLNQCGLLTAFMFDEAGELVKSYCWELTRQGGSYGKSKKGK